MRFSVLDEGGIRGIHDTAVDMLASIGMEMEGEGPRQVLLDAGAREKDGRLLIGGDLVEAALAQVPPGGLEVAGRDPARRVRMAPGEINFRPSGGHPFIVDYPSAKPRSATMQDAEKLARLADALDGIDIVNVAVSPEDIGVGIRNVRRFVHAIRFSTKPTDITASSPEEVAAVHEISVVVRGSREALDREPLVVVYVSPISPMRLSESEALATMECAERGLPLALLSCPTLGVTSPITIAGGVAQEWAEELAQLVLAYAVRPGLPVVACSRLNPADMRRAGVAFTGAAAGLATAALAEVATSFHLPANGWGFASASHTSDLQAGAERMLGTLQAAFAGTSVISGAGALGNALIATPEQLVIDNELIGMVRDAVRGVEVSPHTLAHGHLAEGVSEGTYMTSDHTVQCLRSGELWMADLFSTASYESWLQEGTDLVSSASARVRELLAAHEPAPMDPAQLAEIEAILEAAGA